MYENCFILLLFSRSRRFEEDRHRSGERGRRRLAAGDDVGDARRAPGGEPAGRARASRQPAPRGRGLPA